jgi:hypothetical protein
MALLFHLRLYREAELEMQAFGEMLNPDLYYQYHTISYPGMKGGIVSANTLISSAQQSIFVGQKVDYKRCLWNWPLGLRMLAHPIHAWLL